MAENYYTFRLDCPQRCSFITVLGDNAEDARIDAFTAIRGELGLIARITEDPHGLSNGPDPLCDEPIKGCLRLDGKGYWAWLGYP